MNSSELPDYYFEEFVDPRVRGWLLLGNPIYTILLIIGYIYVVLSLGPKLMAKKEPYSLKTFIFWYNIFQIVANSYIVYMIFVPAYLTEISLGCEPLRMTTRLLDFQMIKAGYWAYLLKIVDFIETFVFVMRKKHNQISFLHLYHHSSTVFVGYFLMTFYPGGMVSMPVMVNCGVHVIMYTYYLFASLGPKIKPYLNPIKPYITRIQIVQFFFLITHQSQAYFPSCSVPNIFPTVVIVDLCLNLVLFLNFYKKSYAKRSETVRIAGKTIKQK